jgi:hypothetical protein
MYIYRIVIDANRINAKNMLPAMGKLEEYFRVGGIEILQTTTLGKEFMATNIQKAKANNYPVIGSDYVFCSLTDDRVSECTPGSSIRQSRRSEIYNLVFKDRPVPGSKDHRNSLRDAMHIDQAWQNMADFFVTDERNIYSASQKLAEAGFDIKVCEDYECLADIESYFASLRFSDLAAGIEKRVKAMGPVILGSNSGWLPIQITDAETGEPLFRLTFDQGFANLYCAIKNKQGETELVISPNEALNWVSPGSNISIASSGGGPIAIGNNKSYSFAVRDRDRPILAATMLTSRRLLVYYAELYDSKGNVAMFIDKGRFTNYCVSYSDCS